MSGTETMGQMYARLLYDKDMNNLLNKYLAGYPLHSPAIEMAENELYNMGMSNMINPKYHPELNAKGALGKTASSIMKGARGAEENGIHIHSVRLPGMVAHQEVIFGKEGEYMTIRHDSTSRICFMSGVLVALRNLNKISKGLTIGLEAVM